jgi:hypothetical protein
MHSSIRRIAAGMMLLVAGCTNPQIGGIDRYAATTAQTYAEARVFYLDDPMEWQVGGGAGKQKAGAAAALPTSEKPAVVVTETAKTGAAAGEAKKEVVKKDEGAELKSAAAEGYGDSTISLRRLRHAYELRRRLDEYDSKWAEKRTELETRSAATGETAAPRTLSPAAIDEAMKLERRAAFVRHNQPLSIIVNKVVMPAYEGTRDMAVILDIDTANKPGEEPLVVWYERDVPGGKELAFQDLLVYYDPAWDSKIPPQFRIRLLDVEKEDNEATRDLLDQVKSLAGAFSGLVPHPIMPGVEVGLEAAKQVLGHQCNTLLMDYTVQFHAAATAGAAGGATLSFLSTGHWIAIGQNMSSRAGAWAEPLYFDERTYRVYGGEDIERLLKSEMPMAVGAATGANTGTGTSGGASSGSPTVMTGYRYPESKRPLVNCPVVLMTVSTAESVVPTRVLDRSKELITYLSESPSKMNFDQLQTSLTTLGSGLKAFLAGRRVDREQSKDAMKNMVDLLEKHKTAISPTANDDAKTHKLSDADVHLLLLTLERQTGLEDKNGLEDWLTWWNSTGKTGSFEFVEGLKRKVWKVPAPSSAGSSPAPTH